LPQRGGPKHAKWKETYMESQEGTFLRAGGIGAAVAFVSLSTIALLLVLAPGAFSGTVGERLAYMIDNSLIAALPWFLACIWAAAEIPVAIALYALARRKDPAGAGLGVVFYLLGICVRFIACVMLLGIVGAVAWAGVAASTFGLVDAVGVCLEGAGLVLTSIAMLLIGLSLTKEKGLLRSVAWLLVASALSFVVGGFFKVLVLMGVALPVALDIAAAFLVGPLAVSITIMFLGLLVYVIWSRLAAVSG
jgi:hypothetical protein